MLPQRAMEHHWRRPGREVSTNINRQSSAAHSRTRSCSGPVSSAIPRAGFAAVQPALTGREHPPLVSVLQVAALAVPGALVELSVIAVLS